MARLQKFMLQKIHAAKEAKYLGIHLAEERKFICKFEKNKNKILSRSK